jgi:uncharacterized membrane protein YgdD (TMEM256/DUF423 family)
MKSRVLLITGMLLMAAAVTLGAFGAHALKETLAASGRTETFELAIRYLMFHSLSLILLGFLMDKFPGLRTAALFLTVGMFFFCGSLLILALANEAAWGAVAPLGGASLIIGWLTAGWTVYKTKS